MNLPHEGAVSRWESDEFDRAQETLKQKGIVATASDKGLTAEFPWDEGASTMIPRGGGLDLTNPEAPLDLETKIALLHLVSEGYRVAARESGVAPDKMHAVCWRSVQSETEEHKRTSLLQLTTLEAHPRIGNGLFCRLELPLKMSDEEAAETASRFNLLEYAALDSPPFFGSWCSSPQSGRVTYVSFWPNLLFHPGTAAMVASWMEHRSAQAYQWITGGNTSDEQQVKWSLASGSKLSSSFGVTRESPGSQKLA